MALSDNLNLLTTSRLGDSLPNLIKIAGIKSASTRKADMVSALDEYLSNRQNVIRIWNNLGDLEKEIIEEFIRSEGALDRSDVEEIFKKHNREYKRRSYGDYFVDNLGENCQARLFFIGNTIPAPILSVLKTFVKPVELKYTALEKLKEKDVHALAVIRESFEKDFINVIMLANRARLGATRGRGAPTKPAAVKINEALENKEPLTEDLNHIGDIRTVEQTTRVYGVSLLLIESGILKERDGIFAVENKAEEFLKLNIVDKCDMLLKAYIESGINELDRIREIKTRITGQPRFKSCREVILKYLLGCPVDKWIPVSELLKFIKKNDRNFLVKLTGEISTYDDYHRYYCTRYQSWEDIEGRFIEIVLLEYLSSVGIVDAALMERQDDYGSINYFSVEYIRLTPLGAYVLGASNGYSFEEKEDGSGFVVQPNYDIVVANGSMKHSHVLFFDRFADKQSEDMVVVYKLTFKSMVNALDNGISIKEIIEYLKEYCNKEIPENVLLTLQDWERESKRIRIRTVTIVETDDKYLLEELMSYKTIKSNILKELPYTFEIDGKSVNKVKREIEKKSRFAEVVIK